MPDNITLTVTPGLVATSATVLDAAAVNLIANPAVELVPNGEIGVDFLDMAAVAEAVGDAATRNYLQKGTFAYEDWQNGTGQTVPANTTGTNAQGWYARTTGGPVTVSRVEDAPSNASTWAARITAGLGNTGVDFYTWVPPAIGGTFRAGDVTFSLWLYNNTGSTKNVRLFLDVAPNTDDQRTLGSSANQTLGTITALPAGVWTRLHLTQESGDFNLERGSAWGVRCLELATSGDSLFVAEAQLEFRDTPTTFVRPGPPPASLAYLSEVTEPESSVGAKLAVQIGSGELRLLGAPPTAIFNPILSWNRELGLPVWVDGDGELVYLNYTGADQIITVPSGLGITAVEVHCWGGGACAYGDRPGGVGGYSWGQMPCTGGNQFAAVIGRAGTFTTGGLQYSFAGDATAGGLTGLFSGTGTVLTTDSARALLIAGGGGSCNGTAPPSPATAGGNGNDPGSSGGEAGFNGAVLIPTTQSGGGGGYAGGSYGSNSTGKGGSGHCRTTGTAPLFTTGAVEFTARTTPVTTGQQLIVPGTSSPYYQNRAGATGMPGLMVLKWII